MKGGYGGAIMDNQDIELLKRLRDDSFRYAKSINGFECLSKTEAEVWHKTCIDAANRIESLLNSVDSDET